MQTNIPFDVILSRLDQLQIALNNLADNIIRPTSPALSSPDRLLDLAEAAQIIRRPIGTVRYYIHHRNLPATRIGKGYLVKLCELLAWEEFNKSEKTVGPVDRMPMAFTSTSAIASLILRRSPLTLS